MQRNPSIPASDPINTAISYLGAAAGNMSIGGMQVLQNMSLFKNQEKAHDFKPQSEQSMFAGLAKTNQVSTDCQVQNLSDVHSKKDIDQQMDYESAQDQFD